jgi:Helix-turn-helix domain
MKKSDRILETMETIGEVGAHFQSLSEPWANTATHAGKLDHDRICGYSRIWTRSDPGTYQRWPRGGQTAGGFTSGDLESSTPKQTKLARRLIDEGKSVREIADTFNVHTATIYRLSATAA